MARRQAWMWVGTASVGAGGVGSSGCPAWPCLTRRHPVRLPKIDHWSILICLTSRIAHCLTSRTRRPSATLPENRPVVDSDLSDVEDRPLHAAHYSRSGRVDGRPPGALLVEQDLLLVGQMLASSADDTVVASMSCKSCSNLGPADGGSDGVGVGRLGVRVTDANLSRICCSLVRCWRRQQTTPSLLQ